MALRDSIKKIYHSIPGVRELCQLRELVLQLKAELAAQRPYEMIATEDALRTHPRFGDQRRLHRAGFRTCSQNLEDGMIAEIFRRVGTPTRTFVEIGVGDGLENNTRLLLLTGWRGWWCEGGVSEVAAIRKSHSRELAEGQLVVCAGMLDATGVASALAAAGVPAEPDLLSIDVDYATYHLWAALPSLRPRVVVVEYNASFPPPIDWVAPAGGTWDGSMLFGASLVAFERLGRERGYALVGCDITGINAFFVRKDLVGDKFLLPHDAATHFEPPRYGAGGHGRRPQDAAMTPRLSGLA